MRRLIGLAAALAAAVWVAASAGASGSGWTVAYSGAHGIWLRSVDGVPRRIRAGSHYGALAWSPDGRWLAYYHPYPDGVYVTDAGGTQWWRVSRADGPPVWSPDGRRIAIAGIAGVWVAAWDGSGERRVLRGNCEAAWSGRDLVAVCGRRLLAVSPQGRVRLLDRPGVDGQLAYLAGSPDGRWVAFGRRCTIVPIGGDTYCEFAGVRPADGGRRTLVRYSYGDWAGPTWDPVWIPGTHELLASDFPRRIVRVDADTGAETNVVRYAHAILAAARDGSFALLEPRAVVVLGPDGHRLARIAVPFASVAVSSSR